MARRESLRNDRRGSGNSRFRHALLAGTALTGVVVVSIVGGRIQPAEAACAADDCWQGGTSTDWFDGTNWSTGVVPGTTTNVIVDQTSPNPNPTIGISVGSNAAQSNTALIGDVSGMMGAVTVDGSAASWTIDGDGSHGAIPLVVGGGGTGFLNITNGGSVTTTGNIGDVVIGSVGTGTVTVGSATTPNLANPSTLTNNGPAFEAGTLTVGDSGTGTLIINPDGVVSGFLGANLAQSSGGQGTITVNGGSLNVIDPHFGLGEMDVGLAGLGTLTIENGGTVTSVAGEIANFVGSGGSSVTVTGTNSTWNITGGSSIGSFTVGDGDVGSLSILAGGTVNAPGIFSVTIGPQANSTNTGSGTLTVNSGELIAYGAPLYVGVAGSPGSTMMVQNGGQVVTDGGQIGGDAPASFNGSNATGVVTVTGAGSQWDAARNSADAVDATSQIFVDNPTSMTGLVIQQGGQVISGSGMVGDFSANGVVNTVTVDDAGSMWTNLTSLNVGYFNSDFFIGSSTGVVNISNGGQVSAPSTNIGVLPDGGAGAIDTISVSGSGSRLQASGTLNVGLFGTGNLTISGGATVNSGTGIIGYSSAAANSLTQSGNPLDTAGVGANSVGTATVTGAGSSWSTTKLIIGDNTNTDTSGTFTGIGGGTATGTLTIADGGAVSVNSGAGAIQVALNAGATGTINIGAADGQTAVAPGTISALAITFGAGTGTIVFNHTSTNYVFNTSIGGPGSVIIDAGTTALTGTNTYSGPTNVNGGALLINSSSTGSPGSVTAGPIGIGTLNLAAGTALKFDGSVNGSLTLANTITVAGDPTFTTDPAHPMTISGTITDAMGPTPGEVAVNDGGVLTFSGANTYSLGTTVSGAGTTVVVTNSTPGTSSSIGIGPLTFDGGILQAGAPGLTFNNAVAINSTGGTIDTNGNALSWTAAINNGTGAGSLTVASTIAGGVLTLSANNGYTGSTTINSGATLALLGGASIAASSGIADNGTFDISGTTSGATINSLSGLGTVTLGSKTLILSSASGTFAGAIGGTGGLTLAGGTETLSGNNGYTGATTITGGTLSIAVATALPTTTDVTVSTGAELKLGDGFNFTINTLSDGTGGSGSAPASVVIGTSDQNSSLSITGGSGTNTFSGQITGAGSLVFSGGGTWALAGAGSNIGGSLEVGNFSSPGTTGGLNITGSLNSAGTTIVLDGTLSVSNGGTLTSGSTGIVSGAAGDAPFVTVTGTGSAWNVAGGLSIGDVFGTATSTVTVADGGTLKITTNNLLNINADGVLNIGSSAGAGTIDVPGIQNNGQIVANFTDSSTLAMEINGNGTLTKQGSGTLTLSGPNGYTGDTNLNGGTIEITNGSALGSSTLKMAGGTTLLMQSSFGSFSNNITLTGDPTFNVAANAIIEASGTISDGTSAGTLGKTGGGTLTLSGANSYTGGTILNGGTITVGNDSALGTGNLSMAAGTTLKFDGSTNGSVTLANAITVAGDPTFITDPAHPMTISGTITDATGPTPGEVVVNGGGVLTLSGANTYSLGTTVSGAGTNVVVTNSIPGTSSSIGIGALTFDGGILQAGANNLSFSNAVNINSTGGTIDTNGNTLTFTGIIGNGSGSGGLTVVSMSSPGTGTLVLSNVNTYTGGTSITGGTLRLSGSGTLGATTNATSISGSASVLNLNGTTQTQSGGISLASGGTAGFGTLNNTTITSTGGFVDAIAGNASLVANGGSTGLGSDTYTGATTINNGAIVFALSPNAFSANSAVTINGTGTLDLDGSNQTIGSLAGTSGTVTSSVAGSAVLTTNALGNASTTFGGVIQNGSGTVGLTKAGTGTLTLTGANIFTGATTITAGTLALSGTGSIANSSGVADAGTFDISGVTAGATIKSLTGAGVVTLGAQTLALSNASTTFAGAINGTGGLTLTAGTETLSGTNTYTGATTIGTGSTLALSGTGTIATSSGVADNGTFDISATNAGASIKTLSGTGTMALGAKTLTLSNAAGTFAGVIVGTGGLTLAGGTEVLTGANSAGHEFTGTANINAGTLQIDGTFGDTAANAATLNVLSGGTLKGTGSFDGSINVASGGTVAAGDSPGTLNVGGNFTLNAGSNSNFELGAPGVVGGANNDLVNVGGNLTLAGTLNLSNPNTPAGQAVQSGYYTLFNVAGTTTGTFATVTTAAGPAASAVTVFDTNGGAAGNQVNALVNTGGQITQFWDGANQSPTGTVAGGTGTWNAANTNWTTQSGAINDLWRSNVGVFMGTAGTVSVVGTQNVQGLQFKTTGYALTGGTLNMTGDVVDTAASFVNVDPGVTVTIGSVLASTTGKGLDVNNGGSGTLILTGTNTYTGLTTITAGTLALSGTGSIAASSGVVDNGTFDISATNAGATITTLSGAGAVALGAQTLTLSNAAGTFSGAIGGSGGLTLAGGTETLTGVNTFTGATTINAGTLALSGTGSIAASSGVADASTFDISGTTAGATIKTLSGAGNVALGSQTLTLSNAVGTFSGAIGGSGGLTLAAGTETLSGANTYTGATTINAGTLALSGAGTIAASSGVADAGTFDISATTAGATIKTLSGAGAVTLGAKTLTLSNAAGTFSGAIGGTGGLTLAGGTETLSGANTFIGATTINAGTLALAGAGTIATSSGVADAGTFDISATTAGATIKTLSGAGAVALGARTLTLSNASSTFSGAIGGTGGLTLAAGTEVLTGTDTYTGATTINAGTLEIGATGKITQSASLGNAGTFQVDGGGAATFTGAVTNSGTLTDNGSLSAATIANNAGGTLTTTGTVTTTGGLTNSGTINANGGAINGAIANNATFNVGGTVTSNATFANANGATLAIAGAGNYTLAGLLTNSGTLTVAAGGKLADTAGITNAATGTITNNGTIMAALTNSGTVTNAATGLWTGNVNSLAGSITNNGTWTGNVTGNVALIQNNATWNATNVAAVNVVNNAGGTLTSTGTLTASTLITNAGTMNAAGNLNGAVTNTGAFNVTGALAENGSAFANNGGTLAVGANAFTGIGALTNAAIVTIGTGGSLSSATFANNAGGTLTTTGTVTTSGGLTNAGTVNANGGAVNGAVTNNATFNVGGTVTGNATFANTAGATLAIAGVGTYTLSGLLTNSGTLTVATGGKLTDTAGITNTATGTITNNGTVTDVLTNAGTVTNNGTYNADVANSGTITNAGTWTTLAAGFANNAGGTLTTTGILNVTAGGLSNSGTVKASGTITGAVANNAGGTFTMTGNVTGITAFANAGTLNTAVALPINLTLGAASFANNAGGVITLQNGAIGDALTLTGTYAGTAGSTVALDVNNTTSAPLGGDQLVIKGASTSGTSSVALAETGVLADKTFFATPIVLINGTPGATFSLATDAATQAVTAPVGLVSYSLAQTQPGQWSLVSNLNGAAGVAAASQIASLISGLNTSFFQATSAFISGPSNPTPNQISGGPWIRFATGDDTISSQSSSSIQPGSQASKVDTNFAGYQAGIDGGIFNIDNTGMNVHLGVTAGQAFATSTDKDAAALGAISKGSSEIPFVGVYGAITGNNFFADVMWRTDFFHLSLTDITAPSLGGVALLNGTSEKATATTITADIGYHFALGQNWFVEPSAAINVSRATVNNLTFIGGINGGGAVTFNNINSNLGRVGFRVGTSFVTGNLALQPFATASLWNEFAGNIESTYQLGSASALIQTSRIGAFGQFGAGLSGQLIGSNLLAYIRADLRTGENIHGWDFTGGLRYQFQ